MSRGKKLVDMVFQKNETKNDNRCNTDTIIEECIVTEDGLLQKIDHSDTTEFFVQGMHCYIYCKKKSRYKRNNSPLLTGQQIIVMEITCYKNIKKLIY